MAELHVFLSYIKARYIANGNHGKFRFFWW